MNTINICIIRYKISDCIVVCAIKKIRKYIKKRSKRNPKYKFE